MTIIGRTLKVFMVSFPVVLWLSFIIVIQIPRGFELMSDTPAPWYQGITTGVFIVCAFFFYPVTLLFQLSGNLDSLLKVSYFIWSLMYSITLSALIFALQRHLARK